MKKFRVPNYDIDISDHEILVINTPTFQRLFRLYQLGLAYMVYPFATHTRAAHAIETLNYAQKIIYSLSKEKREMSDDDIDLIRMSALIHDIAHIPFSHTLEDENIVFKEKHDKKERIQIFLDKIAEEIITPKRNKLSLLEPNEETRKTALDLLSQVKKVLLTIGHTNRDTDDDPSTEEIRKEDLLDYDHWFIADVVGNTISADLLAYIKRDVEFTGIEKEHGGYRIFDYLKLKRDEKKRKRLSIRLTKAGFRIDVFSAILDVLDIRYALMERVVFHHAKCAASAMLARCIRLLNITDSDKLYDSGDEIFLHEALSKAKETRNDAALHIMERLQSRNFYKRIYRVTHAERVEFDKSQEFDFCSRFRDPSKITEFENEIEKRFMLPSGSIAIFCPTKNMHLKEAKVMVDWGKKFVYPLNDKKFQDEYPKFWERVNQIEEKYKELWAFYVFIEPDEFGKTALIQEYLHEKMGVKNDPLLELYLNEKDQYKKSKTFAAIASQTSYDIKSNALEGLLRDAAWGTSENWESDCQIALDSAMSHQIDKASEKKKPGGKSKKIDPTLDIFKKDL